MATNKEHAPRDSPEKFLENTQEIPRFVLPKALELSLQCLEVQGKPLSWNLLDSRGYISLNLRWWKNKPAVLKNPPLPGTQVANDRLNPGTVAPVPNTCATANKKLTSRKRRNKRRAVQHKENVDSKGQNDNAHGVGTSDATNKSLENQQLTHPRKLTSTTFTQTDHENTTLPESVSTQTLTEILTLPASVGTQTLTTTLISQPAQTDPIGPRAIVGTVPGDSGPQPSTPTDLTTLLIASNLMQHDVSSVVTSPSCFSESEFSDVHSEDETDPEPTAVNSCDPTHIQVRLAPSQAVLQQMGAMHHPALSPEIQDLMLNWTIHRGTEVGALADTIQHQLNLQHSLDLILNTGQSLITLDRSQMIGSYNPDIQPMGWLLYTWSTPPLHM